MRSYKLVLCILVIASLLLTNVTKPIDPVYAQSKTKSMTQCENLYIEYKELGEYKFYKKYSHIYTIDMCLSLYKDPTWTFPGKNKIDQQFQKISDVQKILQSKNSDDSKASAKIVTKMKAIQGKYLVDFNICAGKTYLQIPAVLLKSEIDSFLVISKKGIPIGTCKLFEVGIDSKHSDKIEIQVIESVNSVPKSTKVKQVFPQI